jgi:HNH endonuclease/NUMOD4 motif
MEEWRIIDDYPNYEASNTGFIRRKLTKKILKSSTNESVRKYLQVTIWSHKKKFTKYVARLIYNAFSDCKCEQTIDHIDMNPMNNHIDNLRCVSFKENSRNRTIYHYKERKYKITEDDKKEIINKLKSGEWTSWSVMKKYGLPTNYIHMVLKRGTWNKYLNDQQTI